MQVSKHKAIVVASLGGNGNIFYQAYPVPLINTCNHIGVALITHITHAHNLYA